MMRIVSCFGWLLLLVGCVDAFPEIEADDELPVRPPASEPRVPWDGGQPDLAMLDAQQPEPEPTPQPAPQPAPRPEPEPGPGPEPDQHIDAGPPPRDRGMPPPPVDMAPPRTRYMAVATGKHFSCGLRAADSVLVCWGENNHGQLDAPPQRIAHFGLGYDHGCAWDADAAVVRCWGLNDRQQANPETVNWLGVERFVGGDRTTCGVLGGGFACGGVLPRFQIDQPYGSVAVSERHACAHEQNSTDVLCWGDLGDNRGNKPRELIFNSRSLVGSRTHICGINVLTGVSCWGPGPAPPLGSFLKVFPSAGDHMCAIELAGTTRCWGADQHGQATPPPGVRFQQLAGGREHTCGLDTEGFIHCWGRNHLGQTDVP